VLRRMRARSWMALGLAAGTLLLAVALGLHYRALYADVAQGRSLLLEAQDILETGRLDVGEEDLVQAEDRLIRAGQLFDSAQRRLDRDPFLKVAGLLPLASDQVNAGREMMGIGVEASVAGRLAVEAARDFNAVRTGEGGTLLEKSVVLLECARPEMDSLESRLAAIDEDRGRIDEHGLLPPLAAAVGELDKQRDRARELVHDYRRAQELVPSALGFSGPRTYLVLAQNNAELLPTGGLISVYGLVTVREGRIEKMFFEDAVAFSERWTKAGNYAAPPGPLANYLLKGWSWNLALANWSPDFPTAARQAQWFFEAGGGQPVDGVIGIDVTTLEKLLGVVGPVDVPEYAVHVTSENALDVIEANTRSPAHPGDDRKAIVALIADEVLGRVLHAEPSQWSPILDTLQEVGDDKDLLIYLNDANEERLVREMGWDGGLRDGAGDYLMVVDASVNSTKLNIAIDQTLRLDVALDELGNARHQVTLGYVNNLPRWQEGRDPELVRRLMVGGTYGGYVRLLTSPQSRLVAVTEGGRSIGVEEISEEGGKTVFGRFFALPSGQEKALQIEYVSPTIVDAGPDYREYRLLIQKQPGAAPMPLQVSFSLPQGGRPLSLEVDGEKQGPVSELTLDLRRDAELVFRFEVEPMG
jgi:hypothetical protein